MLMALSACPFWCACLSSVPPRYPHRSLTLACSGRRSVWIRRCRRAMDACTHRGIDCTRLISTIIPRLTILQLISVISLLSSDTPNLDSPANVDAAKEVRTDPEGDLGLVARTRPLTFQQVTGKRFGDWYAVVLRKLSINGRHSFCATELDRVVLNYSAQSWLFLLPTSASYLLSHSTILFCHLSLTVYIKFQLEVTS